MPLKAAYLRRKAERAAELQEEQRLRDDARTLAEAALAPATRLEAAEIAGLAMNQGGAKLEVKFTAGVQAVSNQLSQ